MKFTLEGFSQEAALSLTKEVKIKVKGKIQTKTLRLDHTDLILLRWFVDFHPKMKKKIIGETQYAWLNYQSIVDDLPLLSIEKRSVYNRFSKMCELGILIHYHDKDGGSFSYYGFGENYNLLIDTTPMNQNSEGYVPKFQGGMNQNSKGVCNQIPSKDSSTNNPSTNNSSINGEEVKKETAKRFTPPTVEEVKEYCKEHNYRIDPEMFVAFYSSKGWYIGKDKMKDWKQAVVTWELRDKKKNKQDEPKTSYNIQEYEEMSQEDIFKALGVDV